MKENVSPSNEPISAGLIVKIGELLGAALRKSGLPMHPTQEVVEEQGAAIVEACVAEIRKRVEMVSNLITRLVQVNRTRSPQEALEATGRRLYVTDSVVAAMPKGEGEEATLHFFTLGRYVSDDDLEKEYELRGLKAADPYSLAAVNEADPTFADERPNSTHWKDADGNWCYAAFRRFDGERSVGVYRRGYGWSGGWWFAGVRK